MTLRSKTVPLDLTNWFLVFVRAGALLAVFPLFSAPNVPVLLRVALGAMVAFLLAPLLPALPLTHLSLWALLRLLFVELSIGLVLGFVCRMVFFAVEMAGGLIATDMGLMLSSNFNPLASNVTTAPAMLLYWLTAMLLFSLDLHHWMLAGFQRSYVLIPAGGAHLGQAVLGDVILRTSRVFVVGLQISAPVMAVSFVITLVFSLLGRAVPQMNVFSESFSVRTLAGFTVFGMTFNLMAQHIANYLRRLPDDFLRVAQLMGG